MRCGHLIWGIICYCTTACSFRILKKAGEWRLHRFVFVFIPAKIRQKTQWICQICKECDHRNMKVGKLSIFLSNVHISWMHRYHFYDLKVHFWWPNKRFFSDSLSLNTLYEYKGVKELIVFNHTVSNSEFYAMYLIIESTIFFFSQPFVWVTVKPYKTTQFQGELPTGKINSWSWSVNSQSWS